VKEKLRETFLFSVFRQRILERRGTGLAGSSRQFRSLTNTVPLNQPAQYLWRSKLSQFCGPRNELILGHSLKSEITSGIG
jgi:hypothetical protein